jgi:hypothetical protein
MQSNYDISTLLPLNLHFGAEWSYDDLSDWKFLGWLYEGVLYPDSAAFQAAYRNGSVKTSVPNIPGAWADSGQQVRFDHNRILNPVVLMDVELKSVAEKIDC